MDPEHGTHAVVATFRERASASADRYDVERALSRLPQGYREVVILHDLNGYTHGEIAGMLDIEVGTSKSQLQRGRTRLRELLTNTAKSQGISDEREIK